MVQMQPATPQFAMDRMLRYRPVQFDSQAAMFPQVGFTNSSGQAGSHSMSFKPLMHTGGFPQFNPVNSLVNAVLRLVDMVQGLVSQVLGRPVGGQGEQMFPSMPGDMMSIPGQLYPEQMEYLAQTRSGTPTASGRTSSGIKGLFQKGANWLVDKAYGWLNGSLDGSLDKFKDIGFGTFEKLWEGTKAVGSSLWDKVSNFGGGLMGSMKDIGGRLLGGISNIGGSLLNGLGSFF